MLKAHLGGKAPSPILSEWLQGYPVNFDQLIGRVILLEVFQVNCPGCFLNALPLASRLYETYFDQGLSVIGIATAFEDFHINNLRNLTLLLTENIVVGETKRALLQQGKLISGRLPFSIPFPVAMDRLQKRQKTTDRNEVVDFINRHVTDFEERPKIIQQNIYQQVEHYFQSLDYHAKTFELYDLKGTPSYILIDRKGLLRHCEFGSHYNLEQQVQILLRE